MTVRKIFSEYLDARHFKLFEPPCLIGAASEGGANVFKLSYFGRDAFLQADRNCWRQEDGLL